jgi:hypothetical protein
LPWGIYYVVAVLGPGLTPLTAISKIPSHTPYCPTLLICG